MARKIWSDLWKDGDDFEVPLESWPDDSTQETMPEGKLLGSSNLADETIPGWLKDKNVEVESVVGKVYFGTREVDDGVLYRPEELEVLLEGKPDEGTLKMIHDLKDVFEGTVKKELDYDRRIIWPEAKTRQGVRLKKNSRWQKERKGKTATGLIPGQGTFRSAST